MDNLLEGYLVEIAGATETMLECLPQPIDPEAKFFTLIKLPTGWQITIATGGEPLLELGLQRATDAGFNGIQWHFVGSDPSFLAMKASAGHIQRGGATLQ